MVAKNINIGSLVKFFDAFNSSKEFESLAVVIGFQFSSTSWSREKMKMFRILLSDGRVMDVYDYELREL